MKMYDVSIPLTSKTITYPGCQKFSYGSLMSIAKGDVCTFRNLEINTHSGTHIDFPAHMIKDGKNSGDYALSYFIGAGLIVEVPDSEKIITADFLKNVPVQKNDIVLFKTSNSKLWSLSEFSNEFVCPDISAAEWLVSKKVKIVGIDYLTVDTVGDVTFPVHKKLLSNDVLIVECVNLSNVLAGRYEIFIVPMNIPNMDGLPARVFICG